MSSIQFANVRKAFTTMERPAVNDVSFTVEDGAFVVLLGPSGCGKTTLMKMVNRLYDPTAGAIYVGDKDIADLNANQLRRHIGYVIQQIGLFPHMTVAANVGVVPDLLGWEKERIAGRVDELLALVGLPPEEYRDRYPAQMSGGQRQRVGVARALAGDPDVILMDEPFGAIDAITRTGLQDELLRLQRQLKKTILFVTHDVEEALRLADKIVIMRDGKVVQYDSPLHILTQPADSFVAELVGSKDIVRQLGLIPASRAMRTLPVAFTLNGQTRIDENSDLRRALSLLLQSVDGRLVVTRLDEPVGLLTIDDIRLSAGERQAETP